MWRMLNANSQSEVHVERIDADAVCVRCGSVNPEDTLLCKTCGNNLRDQRTQRVVGDNIPELPVAETQKKSLVKIGLGIFGILLIIWVALNIGHIEDMMVGAQTQTPSVESLWNGADNATYDAMLADLDGKPLTYEESDRAQQDPVTDGDLEGRYVLVGKEGLHQHMTVGQALVKKDKAPGTGDRVLFVARIGQSKAEVRGEAKLEESGRLFARNSAGLKYKENFFSADGFAQKSNAGVYECYGMSDFTDEKFWVSAYRLR
jgi:hypothetical protein